MKTMGSQSRIPSQAAAQMDEARRYTPGGVHSSIRAVSFDLVFDRAEGAYLWDVENNRFIDYSAGFAAVILGHVDPGVDQAVVETMRGLGLVGMGTNRHEVALSRKIVECVPSAEMTLLCNTGSEATHHAVRLARTVTGRRKLVKFQGCYHGWHDYVLMNVRSSAEMLGRKDPLSAGMLPEALENTTVLPFNDQESMENTLRTGEYAAVIIEPIAHNMGCVMPDPAYIDHLRRVCDETGTILIFDEIITGFRHGLGGYQEKLGVLPDLTTLGKALANGYPCAAIAGKRELMMQFATGGGTVHFSGTYNAHPVGVAAAIATIAALEDGRVYQHLFELGDYMRNALTEIAARLGIPMLVAGYGSIFVPYFMDPADGLPQRYEDLLRGDLEKDEAFRRALVERGILVFPRPMTRMTMMAAHSRADVDETLSVIEEILAEMR